MKKKNIVPIIVLSVVCIVVAALLGVINKLTSPIIEEKHRLAVQESLRIVMPTGEFADPEELSEDMPDTVVAIYKELNGKGHVVVLKTQGYASEISITVGVDAEGKVTKAVVTAEQETHNKPGMDSYTDAFEGLDDKGVSGVELFTGATVSSTAIKNAVVDALFALGYGQASSGGYVPPDPTLMTEEEIFAEAQRLDPDITSLRDITPDNADIRVNKLYKSNNGKYVAYVYTKGAYVDMESEGVVVFNFFGSIEAISLTNWTVGGEGAVNPTDKFVLSFVGKDSATLGNVDLVSQVTVSSGNFRDAVKAAAEMLPIVTITRVAAIAVFVIAIAAAVTVTVIYKKRRAVK